MSMNDHQIRWLDQLRYSGLQTEYLVFLTCMILILYFDACSTHIEIRILEYRLETRPCPPETSPSPLQPQGMITWGR